MKHALLICVVLLAAAVPEYGLAHEVRPAYLQITQIDSSHYDVVWKQPTQGESAIHLVPHLSNGWLEQRPADQYAAQGFLIRTWHVVTQSAQSLHGVRVEIEGLQDTITDAFINVRLADGKGMQGLLRPEQPYMVFAQQAQPITVLAYLWLGVEHILTGPDHLLFVLGLLLIVRKRRSLLLTVSAFTLAHSLTLTATILGKISLPVTYVETLIALSILVLAPEVIRPQRGGSSLIIRYPWWVAFLFGLFHGMGFASGLTALGFRADDLFATVALFNLGVEIGQLSFIALVLFLAQALRRVHVGWPRYVSALPAYLVGIGGAYWAIQRGVQWFGGQS